MEKSRRFPTLTPLLITGFAAIVVILIVALVVGIANLQDVNATSEAVTHTYAVKTGLRGLLAALVDAETGARGFIIPVTRAISNHTIVRALRLLPT